MGHVQNRACHGRRSIRVRLVVPGLPLFGVLSVLLVVGVALWPGARHLQAQDLQKAPQLLAPPVPTAPLPPVQPPQTQPVPQAIPAPAVQPPRPATAVPPPPIEPVPAQAVAGTFTDEGVVFSSPAMAIAARRFSVPLEPQPPLKEPLPPPPKATLLQTPPPL
jgi:hypothetical protein